MVVKIRFGLQRIAFHKSGKPRTWLRFVLFRRDKTTRKIFERIVRKKNGQVRPNFSSWTVSRNNHKEIQILPRNAPSLNHIEAVLQSVLPLEENVANYSSRAEPQNILTHDEIFNLFSKHKGKTAPSLLIVVSHDNYLESLGGVQVCIQREQKLAADKGFDYLQIHPWKPIPRLANLDEEDDVLVVMVLNGKVIGTAFTSELIEMTKNLKEKGEHQIKIIIHHLMGHLPEQLAKLTLISDAGHCVFWLHDFFSLCPSSNLMRNSVRSCNAPPVTSNSCFICKFSPERATHEHRIAAFFEATKVDLISPSQVTADFWKSHSALNTASITIIPHVTLDDAPPDQAGFKPPIAYGDEVKIGYLGFQVYHKGWSTFTKLMNDPDRTRNHKFVVLSSVRPKMGEDQWIDVTVNAFQTDAMTMAVKEANIDVVLHWPMCFETFSLTTYEAFAGSAYIITNSWSGNVADSVKRTGLGIVLNDEAELVTFFKSGALRRLVDQRRKQKSKAGFRQVESDLSFSLIGEK